MPDPRGDVCASTSRKLALGASVLGATPAVVGFDGFVDEIIAVVDKRHADGRYDSVKTIVSRSGLGVVGVLVLLILGGLPLVVCLLVVVSLFLGVIAG